MICDRTRCVEQYQEICNQATSATLSDYFQKCKVLSRIIIHVKKPRECICA